MLVDVANLLEFEKVQVLSGGFQGAVKAGISTNSGEEILKKLHLF